MVADLYPPYQYEEAGKVKGVDQEIIVQAFKVHGIATETKLRPWQECLGCVERGKADGVFQILPNPEREERFLFSERLRTEKTLLFRATASPAGVLQGHAGDPFQGRRLGVLEGYSYGPAVDRLQEPRKVERKSQEALLQALSAGEVDLILMDAGVAAYLTAKLDIRAVEPVPGYEITRPLHVAFRRQRAWIVSLFNSGLKTVREKGIYDKILESYGVQT
jgi:polar amino acid transport system substrate-binding protein